jgi:hypothetical protein
MMSTKNVMARPSRFAPLALLCAALGQAPVSSAHASTQAAVSSALPGRGARVTHVAPPSIPSRRWVRGPSPRPLRAPPPVRTRLSLLYQSLLL